MLTIYGRKSSANVQKVHWICLEGNLEFKAINLNQINSSCHFNSLNLLESNNHIDDSFFYQKFKCKTHCILFLVISQFNCVIIRWYKISFGPFHSVSEHEIVTKEIIFKRFGCFFVKKICNSFKNAIFIVIFDKTAFFSSEK